eukprot:scaffold3120_cov219-Skeletonema_marinoi.AAC.1
MPGPGPRARGNFLALLCDKGSSSSKFSKSFICHQHQHQQTSFAFAIHERIGIVGNKHAG